MVNDEQDGIVEVHVQVELALSELLTNLRSESVKLSGDKASDIGGIIARVIGALEPILIKAVTIMSEAYFDKYVKLYQLNWTNYIVGFTSINFR